MSAHAIAQSFPGCLHCFPGTAQRSPIGARRAERTRAVTAVFGSLDVGSVVGLLVSGPLIRTYGWPSVFYLFAVLGLAWSAAWPLLKPGDSDPFQLLAPRPLPSAASELYFLKERTSCPRKVRTALTIEGMCDIPECHTCGTQTCKDVMLLRS